MPLTASQQAALEEVAADLGANWEDLYNLIQFESNWNPAAKNPTSSARGLIQFMDKTAQGMGFTGSADLIAQYPTIEAQLRGPVRNYLSTWKPYPTRQSLYMAVFYPVARNWEPTRAFPDSVTAANPGIGSPADYIAFVDSRATGKKNPLLLEEQGEVRQAGVGDLMALGLAGFLVTRPGKRNKIAGIAVAVLLLAKRLSS